MRIQGHEYSFQTRKPAGLFSLCHRRAGSGVFSKEDIKLFNETDKWFKDNLTEPQFYKEGNSVRGITWFKTEAYDAFREKTELLTGLLDKYKVPYDIVYTDYVGDIIYEDEYQVGAADPYELGMLEMFGDISESKKTEEK